MMSMLVILMIVHGLEQHDDTLVLMLLLFVPRIIMTILI